MAMVSLLRLSPHNGYATTGGIDATLPPVGLHVYYTSLRPYLSRRRYITGLVWVRQRTSSYAAIDATFVVIVTFYDIMSVVCQR